MSVTIRLARFGKKFAPSYKIVTTNTKNKRNGRFLDILGYYNPSENPAKFKIDSEKYNKWVADGALVSQSVKKLVEGTYEYKPYKGSTLEKNKKETPQTEQPVNKTENEVVKPHDDATTDAQQTQESKTEDLKSTNETENEEVPDKKDSGTESLETDNSKE